MSSLLHFSRCDNKLVGQILQPVHTPENIQELPLFTFSTLNLKKISKLIQLKARPQVNITICRDVNNCLCARVQRFQSGFGSFGLNFVLFLAAFFLNILKAELRVLKHLNEDGRPDEQFSFNPSCPLYEEMLWFTEKTTHLSKLFSPVLSQTVNMENFAALDGFIV